MRLDLIPTAGIRESFFGPAAYANAQFIQSLIDAPAQNAAIGQSKEKPIVVGFEKEKPMQPGVKTESLGGGDYVRAQTQVKAFTEEVEEDDEELDEDEGDDGGDNGDNGGDNGEPATPTTPTEPQNP